MEEYKTLIITYDNESKEININSSINTYDSFYLKIKNEFSFTANVDIYTSDTNTKINTTNYNELIFNSYELLIEVYLQQTKSLQEEEQQKDNSVLNNVTSTSMISNKTELQYKQNKHIFTIINNNDNIYKCSVCLSEIPSIKYVCTICEECIICDQCELSHNHPVFRFKTPFVTHDKKEIYSIMKTISQINTSPLSILKKQSIKLSENLYNNEITIGTSLKKSFQIKIKNNSQNVLTKNTCWLIVKDYNDLQLKYEKVIKEDIQPSKKITIPIVIIAGPSAKKYKLSFYLFANKKLYQTNSISIKVNVVDDLNEKNLSFYFAEYPEIQLLPKSLMKLLYKIDKDKISNKSPNVVYEILKNNNWNIERAIEKLTTD